MQFLRTILASALMGVCAVVTAATSAQAADEPAADPKPCYQSTYTNHGVTNNHLVFNNGGYRAFVDRRVQRASHPTCFDYVRAAVNFRCQRSNQQGVWVPVNCGADGVLVLYEDGWEQAGNSYDFGSTGPDGTITIYTKWHELGPCKPYWTDLSIHDVTMNYQVQYRGRGYIGPSKSDTQCASNPPTVTTASASAAAEPCAGSRITNNAGRNGFLVFSNRSYRAYVDHRVQRSFDPACEDQVRAAVNFRCQRSSQGGWVPVNCGSAGVITLQESGRNPTNKPYSFGSTGPDGTTSVYGEWVPHRSCSMYWSELYVGQVTMNNQRQFNGGYVGSSYAYRPCP